MSDIFHVPETVRVVSDIPQGFIIINKSDYLADKDSYELYVEPKEPKETKESKEAKDSKDSKEDEDDAPVLRKRG